MSEKVILTSVYKLDEYDKNILAKKHFIIRPDAVFFGNSALVLKPDGTVEYIGRDSSVNDKVKKLQCIVKIVSGSDHAAALGADGRVFAFGDDTCGQCRVSSWENITELFAGKCCTIGIKNGSEILIAGTVDLQPEKDEISRQTIENLKSDIYNYIDRRIREQKRDIQRNIDDSISRSGKRLAEKNVQVSDLKKQEDFGSSFSGSENSYADTHSDTSGLSDAAIEYLEDYGVQDLVSQLQEKKSSDNDVYDKEKIIRFDGYYKREIDTDKNDYLRFYNNGTVKNYTGNGTPEEIMDIFEHDSDEVSKGEWIHKTKYISIKKGFATYERQPKTFLSLQFERDVNIMFSYSVERMKPEDELEMVAEIVVLDVKRESGAHMFFNFEKDADKKNSNAVVQSKENKTSENDLYDEKELIRFDGYYEKKKLFEKNEYLRFYKDGTVMRYFGNGSSEYIMDKLECSCKDSEKGKWYHVFYSNKTEDDYIHYEFEKEKNRGLCYSVYRLVPKDKLDVAVWEENEQGRVSYSNRLFNFHRIDMLQRELDKIASFDIGKALSDME